LARGEEVDSKVKTHCARTPFSVAPGRQKWQKRKRVEGPENNEAPEGDSFDDGDDIGARFRPGTVTMGLPSLPLLGAGSAQVMAAPPQLAPLSGGVARAACASICAHLVWPNPPSANASASASSVTWDAT
jgi:hypothetical protein